MKYIVAEMHNTVYAYCEHTQPQLGQGEAVEVFHNKHHCCEILSTLLFSGGCYYCAAA